MSPLAERVFRPLVGCPVVPWILLLSSVTLPGLAAAAGGGPLTILRTLGGPADDSLVLHRPIDLSWDEEGYAYLLNCGDNRILKFDREWNLVDRFGSEGEGPGEFSFPAGLILHRGELLVQLMGRVVRFTRGGSYVDSRTCVFCTACTSLGGRLLGTAHRGERIGVEFDEDLREARTFGPACEDPRRWEILPGGDSALLLVDLHDGRAYRDEGDGAASGPRDLGLGRGWREPHRGKDALTDICADRRGGYWILHHPEIGGTARLLHLDERLRRDWQWDLGDALRPSEVAVSPGGELCLLDERGSVLHICRDPLDGRAQAGDIRGEAVAVATNDGRERDPVAPPERP